MRAGWRSEQFRAAHLPARSSRSIPAINPHPRRSFRLSTVRPRTSPTAALINACLTNLHIHPPSVFPPQPAVFASQFSLLLHLLKWLSSPPSLCQPVKLFPAQRYAARNSPRSPFLLALLCEWLRLLLPFRSFRSLRTFRRTPLDTLDSTRLALPTS